MRRASGPVRTVIRTVSGHPALTALHAQPPTPATSTDTDPDPSGHTRGTT